MRSGFWTQGVKEANLVWICVEMWEMGTELAMEIEWVFLAADFSRRWQMEIGDGEV